MIKSTIVICSLITAICFSNCSNNNNKKNDAVTNTTQNNNAITNTTSSETTISAGQNAATATSMPQPSANGPMPVPVPEPNKNKAIVVSPNPSNNSTIVNNNIDVAALGKDLCDCMKPLEDELTDKDKETMAMVAAKLDKNLIADSVAMKQFQQDNKADLMKMGFIMMRLQKHLKKDSPTTICRDALNTKYNTINNKLSTDQTIQLADALNSNGCTFMATMIKMSGEKF